jgi:hypothetical protein
MPITANKFKKNPYLVGTFQVPASVAGNVPIAGPGPPPPVPAVVTKYRIKHTIYPTDIARNDLNIALPSGTDARYRLSGTANIGGGDVIYLKYFDDEVTSVRLPCPAPAGVELFVTDTLTGCKFFVDTIAGSNDLMVYHANTHQHSAGAGADCDVQTPAADGLLDNLHQAAQADYLAHGITLNNLAECAKPTYYGAGGDAERRKRNQARGQGPTFQAGQAIFAGGCTIVGIPSGNSWDFYYQVYGTVDYSRPDIHLAKAIVTFKWHYTHKKIWKGLQHGAAYADMEVYGWGQIQ